MKKLEALPVLSKQFSFTAIKEDKKPALMKKEFSFKLNPIVKESAVAVKVPAVDQDLTQAESISQPDEDDLETNNFPVMNFKLI